MPVPPRRFFGLAGKLRNHHLFHFCFCHVYSSPHCLVQIRCLFVRSPACYWTHRLTPDGKHDVQYATGASRTDRNPALFVPFHLVFQKDVISGQHVFRVGALIPCFARCCSLCSSQSNSWASLTAHSVHQLYIHSTST